MRIIQILTALFIGLATVVAAQEREPAREDEIERVRAVLAHRLARAPQDRALRFRYAQASYQSGHFDAAKHHLRVLMRTSRTRRELGELQKAYAEVVDRSHWSFGATFSLLPSTNINKTSSNIYFDTPFGQFLIEDGGAEESGIGFRLGGRASYESVLRNGQTLSYNFGLTRVQFPEPRLNRTEASFGLTWGLRAVGSETRITPTVLRYRYDTSGGDSASSMRYRIGINHQRFLPKGRSISGSLSAEYRDYDLQDHLDGPVLSSGLIYQTPAFGRFRLSGGVALTRGTPRLPHLRYTGATVTGGLAWPVARVGTFGITAGLGGRFYDGDFPALGTPRQDRFASIGVSATSPQIRIWGSSPKISCKYQQGWSNVALYDYQSTDCALTFERSF